MSAVESVTNGNRLSLFEKRPNCAGLCVGRRPRRPSVDLCCVACYLCDVTSEKCN